MRLKVLSGLLVVGLILGVSGVAFATNSIKTQFNTRYGTTGSRLNQCILCHATNSGADIPSTEIPPNPYGVALENNAVNFAAVELLDSDGDGFSNLAEIHVRTFPGNPQSHKWIVDFDKDGKTDITVYRSNAGAWYVHPSSGAASYGVGWGGDASDKPVPGDYDGDGKTDIAFYRATTGVWWIIPSSGIPTGTPAPYGVGWGGTGFTAVPGDYDGDGKTDVAIYNSTTGAWWIKPSSGAAAYGVGWGGTGFTAVPGDYDGDGKTDVAIYDSITGAWWIKPSSGAAAYGVGWGGDASDKPVPGDYDEDGKDDIAVYRANTGAWWIIPSSGIPTGTPAPYGVGWGGNATDIPVILNASIY